MMSRWARSVLLGMVMFGLGWSAMADKPESIGVSSLVITRAVVEQHAKQISFSLKKRRVIRASLITVAAGIFAYQSWELVRWFMSTKALPEQGDGAAQCTKKRQKQQSLFPSGVSWASAGKVGLKLGASILAGQMLHMLVGKYIVPDSLSWYVHVCAPYRKILLEIDAHVIGLEQAHAKKIDRIGYHLQSITSAYHDLVARLTHVIGYMCFRAGDFLPQKVDEANKLIDYMIDVVNDCSSKLAVLCGAGGCADSQHLSHVLDTLGVALDAACLQFSRLEGSFWYDGGYARRSSVPRPRQSVSSSDAA